MNSSLSTPSTMACSGIGTRARAQASRTSFALASHAANMPHGFGRRFDHSASAASSLRWLLRAVLGDLNSEKEHPAAAASLRNAAPRSPLHSSSVRVPTKAKCARRFPAKTFAADSATAVLLQYTLPQRSVVGAAGLALTKTAARHPSASTERRVASSVAPRMIPSGRQARNSSRRRRGVPIP